MRDMRRNPRNTGDGVTGARWQSYNFKNAISFGFEYKEGLCGSIMVRHSERPARVWSFSMHPSPELFYLMENYPTLVGLDDTALMKLVMSQEKLNLENEKKSEKIEALKKALETTRGEQELQQELHRENEEVERQRRNVLDGRQQRNFQRLLREQKENIEAEKRAVKEVYVQRVDAILAEKEVVSAKLESMETPDPLFPNLRKT